MSPDNLPTNKLELRDICKSFPSQNGNTARLDVLREISFSVKTGELLCILGPSGCGKTTLLKVIQGLLHPDGGQINVDGQPVRGPGYDRALIFQEINLLPWRTALGNITVGLEFKGMGRKRAEGKAVHHLEMVGLKDFRDYYPHQLSGGMKQRIGIARALAVDPDVLLCDEPFGYLDALTRQILQVELLKILQQTKKTAVFVTHSIDEAIFLGDRVMVLSRRPASIKKELIIEIKRPRIMPDTKLTTIFAQYKKTLWEAVVSEQGNGVE